MDEQEKLALQAFIDELSALSEKHSITIQNEKGYGDTFVINGQWLYHGFKFNYETRKYESEELK